MVKEPETSTTSTDEERTGDELPFGEKSLDDIAKYLEDQFKNTKAERYNLDAIAVVLKNQLAANGYDPESFHMEVEQDTGNIYVVPNGRKFVDSSENETVQFTLSELKKVLVDCCRDYADKVLYERQIGRHSITTAEYYANRMAPIYFLEQKNKNNDKNEENDD